MNENNKVGIGHRDQIGRQVISMKKRQMFENMRMNVIQRGYVHYNVSGERVCLSTDIQGFKMAPTAI